MGSTLSKAQEELIAIGAAIATNCGPCLSHHVRLARETGLTDTEIEAAVVIAQRVKETPSRLIIEAARRLLGTSEQLEQLSVEPPKSDCCR